MTRKGIVCFVGGFLLFILVVTLWVYCLSLPRSKSRPREAYAPVRQTIAPAFGVYPREIALPIYRDVWSETMTEEVYERLDWILYETIPLRIMIDGTLVGTEAPGDNFNIPEAKRRQVRFMIGDGGDASVTEATVHCTFTHR